MPSKGKKRPSEHGTVMAGAKRRKSNKPGHIAGQIYTAEKILAYRQAVERQEKRTVYVLIKWFGYGEDSSTWEDVRNVNASREMVDAFLLTQNKKLVIDASRKESWIENL